MVRRHRQKIDNLHLGPIIHPASSFCLRSGKVRALLRAIVTLKPSRLRSYAAVDTILYSFERSEEEILKVDQSWCRPYSVSTVEDVAVYVAAETMGARSKTSWKNVSSYSYLTSAAHVTTDSSAVPAVISTLVSVRNCR